MTHKEMIEVFEKFLIEKNCLEEYKRNVEKDPVTTQDTVYARKHREWIDSAFPWYRAHEGVVYWHNIHREWLKKIDEEKLIVEY